MLNNPNSYKIILPSENLGYTLLDVDRNQNISTMYSITNNIDFVDVDRNQNISTMYSISNNIDFVDQLRDNYPQYAEYFEVSKVSQTVYDDKDLAMFDCEQTELAIDFSSESKYLRQQAEINNPVHRPKQLLSSFLKKFHPEDQEF